MKTLAIVQARMSSTRLPGKVLMPIGKHAALYHVLHRTRDSGYPVVLAIPWKDRELELFGEIVGVPVVKGPLDDVLGRYTMAAEEHGADVIIRITADCPLVDPEIVQDVACLVEEGADYASNVWPDRTWPQGLDVEAFTMETLRIANREATDDYSREHVTPHIRKVAPSISCRRNPQGDFSHYRWTLDTPEDYRFFQELAAHMPWEPPRPTTDEVLDLLQERPEIQAINAGVAHIYPPDGRAA